VESEIAKGIAESLQTKLTGREQQALAAKPTNNPEAYDAYLHGLALEVRLITSNNEGKPIDSYKRAVQLDPNFAVAWARLSRANGVAYSGGNDPAMRDAAKRALEQAQKLEPNSPETLLALGNYQYLVLNDYEAAKTTFERLNEMLPGSSEVPYALGRVARRAGHWDESVSYFDRAINLDPGNVEILTNAAQTYIALRRFPTALKLCDRLEDVAGNDSGSIALKIVIYHAQGNLKEADKILNAQSPDHPLALKWVALRLERNYGEALQFLQTVLAERLPYEWFHFTSEEEKAGVKLKFALMQRLAGDVVGAKVTAEQARNTFEPLYTDKPEDLDLTTQLSWAYALTEEKDLALKLAERAVMLRPRAKDAPWGPKFEENLALVETMVGENSRAISTLTKLLQTPYWGYYGGAPITLALLRLDPIWDPLRSDPAFQKLCEEKQP
jgi:tetratricopeptide (TPR) repeat protein